MCVCVHGLGRSVDTQQDQPVHYNYIYTHSCSSLDIKNYSEMS